MFSLLFTAETLAGEQTQILKLTVSAVLGTMLLVFGTIHLKRTPNPIVSPDIFPIRTFSVAIRGGSVFRMGVSAVPFLLPLMFQLGFGYNSFHAGMMLMAVFAGNLSMKPMTTAIMRRFGFRRVLLVNGFLNAVSIALIAAFTTGAPLVLMCAILVVGGMTRSLQFTTVNSIAFADIPQNRISAANTLFSSAFQLAMGGGVAAAAIAWRIGQSLQPSLSPDPLTPFRIAFLLISTLSLISLLDILRLSPTDASHVISPLKK